MHYDLSEMLSINFFLLSVTLFFFSYLILHFTYPALMHTKLIVVQSSYRTYFNTTEGILKHVVSTLHRATSDGRNQGQGPLHQKQTTATAINKSHVQGIFQFFFNQIFV